MDSLFCAFVPNQESIEVAIQLGLEGPEVVAATTMHHELARLEAVKQELVAAINMLLSKAENEAGIQASDVAPITQALSRTTASGLPRDDPLVEAAMELHAKMSKQLEIQVRT